MKKRNFNIFCQLATIIFASLFATNTSFAKQLTIEHSKFQWPNGEKAAVNLAYDDALKSQLDYAIPALNKLSLVGSFYLTLDSATVKSNVTQWKKAASMGHELGNHTIYHACRGSLPNRDWVSPKNDLDKKTVTELVAEIRKANKMLTKLDNKKLRTFTLPCGDNLAGFKDFVTTVQPLFTAIKTHVGDIPKSMAQVDLDNIAVIAPVDVSGKQLISYVKQAEKYGTMVNFTFHGIGADYLSISREAHQQLLQYLAKNKSKYWVATSVDISNFIQLQRIKH